MRILGIFLALAVLFLIPFLIWGGDLEALFSSGGAVDWLAGFGPWAGLVGMLLLSADLVLPLPGTLIMSALGFLYGTLLGGLLSAVGSVVSGMIAYEGCRRFGRGVARWLLGERDMARGEAWASRIGGWVVVLSRWLPLLPEVVACMAGLVRMRARVFYAALICGSVPMAFAFAAVGALGWERPGLALLLSAVGPAVLWLLAHALIRRAWHTGNPADENRTPSA